MDDRNRRFRRVFSLPFARSRIDRALDDELGFHLDGRIREFEEKGMSRAEAEAEARRRFGDFETYRREAKSIDEIIVRSRGRMELWDILRREVGHAARVLVRTPAFSVIAVVTLALGIGATTAIFAVLEGVLLRPLPYHRPEELVSVLHPTTVPGTGEGKWGLASVGYFHFKENAKSFTNLGAYRTYSTAVSQPGRDAVQARGSSVTASMFPTLGARAHLGRLITEADDRLGAPRIAVLSYEFWRRQFGEDPKIIGRSIETGSGPRQIIGVTEPGLTLPKPGPFASMADLAGFGVDLWTPLQLDPAERVNSHQYSGVARLRPGVTVDAAQRELAAMTQQFPEHYPSVYSPSFMSSYNFRVGVTPLRDEMLGPTVGRALWILFGAVGLVLIIACANVANLFLVRMEARRREAAIRGALGASRGQMAIHYLAESLLLCLTAGVTGLLVARGGLAAILAVAPRSIPRLTTVGIEWTTIVFALLLALVAGLVFGLLPLVRSATDMETIRESSRGLTSSPRQRVARNGLVVAQIALALMLLVGAGLMIRSFLHLRDVKPGLNPEGVLTFSVSLPGSVRDMEAAAAFHRLLSERIAALPGVTAVGAASGLPLRDFGAGCSVVWRENRPYASGEQPPCVHTPAAIPGFFKALGIQVRGRAPEWSDVDTKTHAVVVTQALADRLWPDEDPIGKGIGSNGRDSRVWYRIVGVIPELRAGGLDQPPTEAVFYAATPLHAQMSRWGYLHSQVYAVKVARGDPVSLVPAVRSILSELNSQIPIVNPMTMRSVFERSMSRTSFIMLLLGLAAGMALVLSAVGIYGVISYLVAQRRSEIGVRIALGSSMSQVVGLVMSQSIRLAIIGVSLGMVGAIVGTRLIQSLLFGVAAHDPVVLGLVPLILIAIAAFASFAPARRAARVDPVEALRAA